MQNRNGKLFLVREHKQKSRKIIKSYSRDDKSFQNIKRRRLYNQKKHKEARQKTRKFLFSKLGNQCIICGKPNTKFNIIFHEIHCKKHGFLVLKRIKTQWQNFVPMCKNCHKILHHFIKHRKKFERLLE